MRSFVRNIKVLILPVIFWFSAAHTFGQSVTISSLEEAIDIALAENIDYQNYIINQEKANLEYKQSRRFRLPTVSGTFNGQRNGNLATTPVPGEFFGQPGEVVYAQFGQRYNYNAGINATQELINREASLKSKISKLKNSMAASDQNLFESVLREQISLYYYTGLIANRAVQLGQEDLENATKVLELTELKFDEGLIDKISANHATINKNMIEQSLVSSGQLERQCNTELKILLGVKPTDSLTIAGQFDYSIPQNFEVAQLNAHPQIIKEELNTEQADLQVKLSQSSLLPSIALSTYYGAQQFGDDLILGFGPGDWSSYSYISLSLNVPIFTGFNNRSNIKISKLNQEIASNQKLEVERNQQVKDEQLITDYKYSLKEAALALETYHLYEENSRLSLSKYEEGLISLDQYLNIFEDYIRAENAYLNAMTSIFTYYSKIISRVSI